MNKDLEALRIAKDKKVSPGSNALFWKILSLILFICLVTVSAYVLTPGLIDEEIGRVTTTNSQVDPQVMAETVKKLPAREVLISSGYIVAHHKHELGSKVMGKVQWIGVEKGDRVSKGQLLVKLEDGEYRAKLEQAQASLRLAKMRLREMEAGARPEEISRAEAQLVRARVDQKNAQLKLKRAEGLIEENAIARETLDDVRTRYDMATATMNMAKKDLELLRAGPRLERIEQVKAEVAQATANVNYFQTMLEATEIRAPVAGTVLRRIAEVGEMVTTSFAGASGAKSAVIALADLDDLQVELDISQTDFNRISTEHLCRMTPEAYPEREYECKIDEIAPEADRQKASIQIKVKILNPDKYLRPEMSARVTFLGREKK